ncbi:MAG: hypothetical protein KME45_09615 [Stenomitos rutilans HA7619-LM2]|nr:hypothetical protein [Stenomitos rutilans HA7619-LM2]
MVRSCTHHSTACFLAVYLGAPSQATAIVVNNGLHAYAVKQEVGGEPALPTSQN